MYCLGMNLDPAKTLLSFPQHVGVNAQFKSIFARLVEHIFRSTGKAHWSVHTQLGFAYLTGRSGLADRILGCNFFGVTEVVVVDGYVVMMMMMMMPLQHQLTC